MPQPGILVLAFPALDQALAQVPSLVSVLWGTTSAMELLSSPTLV
jgi:hypothetical protein